MSVIILILSLNGNLVSSTIPLKYDVEQCKESSLPKLRQEYVGSPLTIVSAKCFSTLE